MAYLSSGKKKLLGSNTEGKGIDFWQPNTDYKISDLCLYKEKKYYSVFGCQKSMPLPSVLEPNSFFLPLDKYAILYHLT